MKNYRFYLLIISILLALFSSVFLYTHYIQSNTKKMKDSIYKLQAENMRATLDGMILQKQKATLAIALGLANDTDLLRQIETKNIDTKRYKNLISEFEEYTLYKNVWIQILDSNATSLYRSWSDIKGDNLLHVRKDLADIVKNRKITSSISVGKFDLSIKSIIPVLKDTKFIGIIEVITHFNSFSRNLADADIGSVVVLKKAYRQQLKYPFTKLFIDDYYVANFDAPKELRDYLITNGVENYFNDSYRVENDYIILSYELKDNLSNTLGYFIMFKKISNIQSVDLEFFTFKSIAIFMLIGLMILSIIISILLVKYKNQQEYFKNILDTSSNIVIISDGQQLISANKTFFKYFYNYRSLDEFLKEYNCICNMFVNEEGYLQPKMDSLNWVEHILKDEHATHKAKIHYLDNIYYFIVTVALISKAKNHYSIVFSDITKEEHYQKELLLLSTEDALTCIHNRRYFDQKINHEIAMANRYPTPFSLILFDIDFFKRVNDQYGHDVGDQILVEYTKLIASMLRQTDIFCRIGGEEFTIILPHTTSEDAKKIAQKLCYEIEHAKIILPITMSFGVTQHKQDDTPQSILKRADRALYSAKEKGRNRVVVG